MHSKPLVQLALRILKALDVPEAQVTAELIKNREWDKLATQKFDPLQYHHLTASQFRKTALAMEFLRKGDFIDTTFDRAQRARDGFLACERQCATANLRLSKYLDHPVFETKVEQRFSDVLIKARAWMRGTLGLVPLPLSSELFGPGLKQSQTPVNLTGRFGPGAVFEKEAWAHRTVTQYDKLRNTPHVTMHTDRALISHLSMDSGMRFAWNVESPDQFPLVRGNRFTSVPKDATKDRGIAIEPSLNVFGQLAIGDLLKTRLLRRNIDLRGTHTEFHSYTKQVFGELGLSFGCTRMGQDLHRREAREASRTGSKATIDLSNASDTVCYNLVKLLLPGEWFTLLSSLRSPFTLFSPTGKRKDRRWYRLEKFSSMGNGYTFELETLIFCALAHAVGCEIGSDSFVYGDDIIVPTEKARDVLAILKFCGLTPNERKTFVDPECKFRESCGGDFLSGVDVRPFYITEEPTDAAGWIYLANTIREWADKWSIPELLGAWRHALDQMPSAVRRLRGPKDLGDLVVHDDDPRTWDVVVRSGIRYVRVWRPVQRKLYLHSVLLRNEAGRPVKDSQGRALREFTEQGVALTAALIGLPSTGISPRESVEGFRFGRVAFS